MMFLNKVVIGLNLIPGKSKKVLGGIGTILLSPDINGNVLMSVSAGCNASTGIPLLIFRSVLEILNIQQGDIVDIKEQGGNNLILNGPNVSLQQVVFQEVFNNRFAK